MDYRNAPPWKGFDRDEGTEARARRAYFAAEAAVNAECPVMWDSLRVSVDHHTRLQPGVVGEVTSLSGRSADLLPGGPFWNCPLCGASFLRVTAEATHLIPCRGYGDIVSLFSSTQQASLHAAISADPEEVAFLCTTNGRFLHGMTNLVMLCPGCSTFVNLWMGLEFNPTTNAWDFVNHNPAGILRPPRTPCSPVVNAFLRSSAEVAQHVQWHNRLMKILAHCHLCLKIQAGSEEDFEDEEYEELIAICIGDGLGENTMSLQERVALLDAG
jgi:hypothetical protein